MGKREPTGAVSRWLSVLKNDERAIFTAAAHAEQAYGFLHARQSEAIREGAA